MPTGDSVTHRDDPPQVRQISAPELKTMLESETPPLLIDVRTAQEWAIARIPGARLLNEETLAWLVGQERDTPVVFGCHHGIRSQAAAEYFLQQGFRRVHNLAGVIDAWSQLVDPAVPRY